MPSHCLNQCWLIVNWIPRIKFQWNLNQNTKKPKKLNVSTAKCQPFCPGGDELTHWGRVMHICVSKLTIIGSDKGLSPDRRQAIIRTNAGILLIRSLETNFSEMFIKIHTLSFKKIHLKMSSGKWSPFCLGLNELTNRILHTVWQRQK